VAQEPAAVGLLAGRPVGTAAEEERAHPGAPVGGAVRRRALPEQPLRPVVAEPAPGVRQRGVAERYLPEHERPLDEPVHARQVANVAGEVCLGPPRLRAWLAVNVLLEA
jgi:hypothetical protein